MSPTPTYEATFKPGDVVDIGNSLIRIIKKAEAMEQNIYLAKSLFDTKPHLWLLGPKAKVVTHIEGVDESPLPDR
jgi:hypothetical protein